MLLNKENLKKEVKEPEKRKNSVDVGLFLGKDFQAKI